jgi:hypothetical protein
MSLGAARLRMLRSRADAAPGPRPRDPRRQRRPWRGWLLVLLVPLATLIAEPWQGRDAALGVTFSPRFARWLGLDPLVLYVEMLDELGVRHVRLPAYWGEVEPSPDVYDFSALDPYLAEAERRGVEVVLVVGY